MPSVILFREVNNPCMWELAALAELHYKIGRKINTVHLAAISKVSAVRHDAAISELMLTMQL